MKCSAAGRNKPRDDPTPKPTSIELPTGELIPILYEDRSVLAVDKPRGWMLVPFSWQRTSHNLQAALTSSIAAGDFWARSRNLRFLRFVHRLDAETTGVLLFGKSPGAVKTIGELFEGRAMSKVYLAVVKGTPIQKEWHCLLKIGPDPAQRGKMCVDDRHGKAAETEFRVLETRNDQSLVEARPVTGRTHQIRVHLAEMGFPVVGDEIYGSAERELGLRAVQLAYRDPFTSRAVQIGASAVQFLKRHGFSGKTQ